jgi:hypothetical protein
VFVPITFLAAEKHVLFLFLALTLFCCCMYLCISDKLCS